jgi:transcriptional regulator with XRE-family HTH domain
LNPFGPELKRVREHTGLTQRQIAIRSGLSYRAIGYLENNQRVWPSSATLAMLAKATHGYWIVNQYGIYWREL